MSKKEYFYDVVNLAAAVGYDGDITMSRWDDPEWQKVMQEMYDSVADFLPETYEELDQDVERRDQWITLFSDLADAYYCFEKER